MSFWDVMNSEAGLALTAAALGSVWALFKSSEWYSRAQSQRYHKAVEALEAGVEKTYREYVQALKASREDGKLEEAEKEQARELAQNTAVEFGQTQGVDVLRELGRDYIDLWTAKLVKKLKRS